MHVQTLLKRIKKRDDLAFNELYQLTRYQVYAIIFAIIQDPVETEDLMQEAYMRMLSALDRYDGSVKFTTWLLTIAKNLAIDHYRKYERLKKVDLQDQEYLFPSQKDNQYQSYETFKYLSILSEEERKIVLLKVLGRLKHHEIGALLDKPKGTVMWLYNVAIKKMREYGKEG